MHLGMSLVGNNGVINKFRAYCNDPHHVYVVFFEFYGGNRRGFLRHGMYEIRSICVGTQNKNATLRFPTLRSLPIHLLLAPFTSSRTFGLSGIESTAAADIAVRGRVPPPVSSYTTQPAFGFVVSRALIMSRTTRVQHDRLMSAVHVLENLEGDSTMCVGIPSLYYLPHLQLLVEHHRHTDLPTTSTPMRLEAL